MENKDDYLYSISNDNFELSVISVLGNRDEQQDSFGYSMDKNRGVFVLCDGMGGYEGGRNISILAVEKMLEKYSQMSNKNQVESLNNATRQINSEIIELKNNNSTLSRAGSTIVTILVDDGRLHWSAMGDSRAYLMRNDEFVQITQDQNYSTVLNEKLRKGLLDENEYQREMSSGETLISFLGASENCLLDYNDVHFELENNDIIIMMSDGLYKLVSDEEIKTILGKFANGSDALLKLNESAARYALRDNVKRDNMTVAVIRIKRENRV